MTRLAAKPPTGGSSAPASAPGPAAVQPDGSAAPAFKQGDQVRIIGANPWRGHSGTITGPMPAGPHGLDWIVDLPDVLMTAGVAEKNLCKVN